MGVTRCRKIESDRDYQKNKERVQELKVLGKKEKLHSTIKKYEGGPITTKPTKDTKILDKWRFIYQQSPFGSIYLTQGCSNFFNPSKKDVFWRSAK